MFGNATLGRPQRPTRRAGFSLVELLIVLVIIGIIAMFAYPAYTQQVVKSNRAQAKIALLRIAQRQERYKTERLRYAQSLVDLNEADKTDAGRTGEHHYALAMTATDTTFTVTATPLSALQKRDAACTSLSINESGLQRADGAGGPDKASAECWN